MADGMRQHFAEHVRRTRLFQERGPAVLAVSGGPDSLAMLDLFATGGIGSPPVASGRRNSPPIALVVAHADHGIHSASSEVAERVRSLARDRYGLDAVIGRLELGAAATETTARRARYRFLRQVQADHAARYLVTAHHADDQAETVLLRVLRGSAPAGLAGIPARGPGGLRRPLLPFRREELAAHVQAAGLEPFEDPANADARHLRSWLRAQVMPVLAARLGDSAVSGLLGVAAHARYDVRAWDRVLDMVPLDLRNDKGVASVARSVLAGYDAALGVALLRAAARRGGLRLGPAAAERLVRWLPDAASGRRLELGQGIVAEVAFDQLFLAGQRSSGSVQPSPVAIQGPAGEAAFGAFSVRWSREPAPAVIERASWTTWLAPDTLAVRAVMPGDRLEPLGGTGRRSVSRLLMEAKVPRSDREGWPLVVSGGDPVWIPGVCRGGAAIPQPGARAVRLDARSR